MRYMCAKCGDIAVALIGMDVGRSIRFLLVGAEKSDSPIEATGHHRPPQQLREIIELIGELMPNLPNDELFEVNSALNSYTASPTNHTYNLSTAIGGAIGVERLEQLIQRSRYPFEV